MALPLLHLAPLVFSPCFFSSSQSPLYPRKSVWPLTSYWLFSFYYTSHRNTFHTVYGYPRTFCLIRHLGVLIKSHVGLTAEEFKWTLLISFTLLSSFCLITTSRIYFHKFLFHKTVKACAILCCFKASWKATLMHVKWKMKVLGKISLLLTYLIIVTFKLLMSINVKNIFINRWNYPMSM